MDEFQSIDISPTFEEDEGNRRDDATAPAPPFGSTSGSEAFKAYNV